MAGVAIALQTHQVKERSLFSTVSGDLLSLTGGRGALIGVVCPSGGVASCQSWGEEQFPKTKAGRAHRPPLCTQPSTVSRVENAHSSAQVFLVL